MNLIKQGIELFTALKSYVTTTYLTDKSVVMNKPMSLVDIVNTYNQPYTRRYPLAAGPQIDAQISKNTPARNLIIANLITSESQRVGIDLIYLAACIFQESMFSETCFNHNLKEHNGVETFEGTDWGLTQQAGSFLKEKPGMAGLTNEQMAAKACTAEWAIPVMANIMAANIKYFNQTIQSKEDFAANLKELNTTNLSDVEWASTLAYNKGLLGATMDIMSKDVTKIAHPNAVAKHYDDFTKAMQTK